MPAATVWGATLLFAKSRNLGQLPWLGVHKRAGGLYFCFSSRYFESKRIDALKLAKVANWFSVLEEHEFMLVDQGTEALTG